MTSGVELHTSDGAQGRLADILSTPVEACCDIQQLCSGLVSVPLSVSWRVAVIERTADEAQKTILCEQHEILS